MRRLDVKSFILLVAVFCCTVIYAKNQPTYSEKINGGSEVTVCGECYVGYASTSREVDGKGNVKVKCSGSGSNKCNTGMSNSTGGSSVVYDEAIKTIRYYIDIGLTAGEFVIADFVCTWSEGEKKEEEKADGKITSIYSYNLEIAPIFMEDITIIPMTITVFPNPLSEGNLSVHFSSPINAMINVRIVDMEGDTRLVSDMYVTDEVLVLPVSGTYHLSTGTYHIICTDADGETAHATFFKR